MSNVFDFELQSLVAKLPGPSARGKDSGSVFGPIGGVGRKRSWVYTLLCLLFLVPLTNAQIRSDTITGLATDPNGALIVGADVIVSNTGTHATSSTRTTDTGRYTVPYLETGTYHVVNTVRLTTSQSRIDFRYRSHSIYGSGASIWARLCSLSAGVLRLSITTEITRRMITTTVRSGLPWL